MDGSTGGIAENTNATINQSTISEVQVVLSDHRRSKMMSNSAAPTEIADYSKQTDNRGGPLYDASQPIMSQRFLQNFNDNEVDDSNSFQISNDKINLSSINKLTQDQIDHTDQSGTPVGVPTRFNRNKKKHLHSNRESKQFTDPMSMNTPTEGVVKGTK